MSANAETTYADTAMNKAKLFVKLQNKVNAEIDQLGNELTTTEINEVCELYQKLGEFLVHDLPNYKNGKN